MWLSFDVLIYGMKRLLVLFLCLPLCAAGQRKIQLSENATISVITCGPGQEELYSAFGHSAFRVFDPANRIDLAYNYGVFNFDQPNFYLNFAKGYLYYKLGVADYQRFEYPYIYFNRYVHEQVLNLTPEQKQKVFDFLQWNALPENENYRYDYFYNNCATKMRDVIVEVLGDAVHFDGAYIQTDYSIRELTDLYLGQQPWGDLGIDICLGLPMDKTASPYEYMFLPDYVESGFDHATIDHYGETVKLVKEKKIIYTPREQEAPKGLPHPLLVFSVLALVGFGISFLDLKRRKLSIWFDATLFGVTGAIGLLLFMLWFFTDHQAAARNLNILWALPTHLVAVLAFIKNPRWLKNYFGAVLIVYVLLLLSWPLLPQQLHYALIPIVATLGLRAFTQYRLQPVAKQKN